MSYVVMSSCLVYKMFNVHCGPREHCNFKFCVCNLYIWFFDNKADFDFDFFCVRKGVLKRFSLLPKRFPQMF